MADPTPEPVSCGDRCGISSDLIALRGVFHPTLRPAPLDGNLERWYSFITLSPIFGQESTGEIWLGLNTCALGAVRQPLLADPSGLISYIDPAWSPDGRFLAYVQTDNDVTSSSIYIQEFQLSLDIVEATVRVGVPRLVVAGGAGAHNRHPAWRADGLELAFDSDASGVSIDLYTVAVDPAGPLPVPPPSAVRRTFNDTRAEFKPAYSPDGRRLAFVSNRFGPFVIEIVDLGTGQIALAETNFIFVHHDNPRWSTDGQAILYDAPANEDPTNTHRIWCLTLATQAKRQVTSNNQFAESGVDISHRTNLTVDGTPFNYVVFNSSGARTVSRAVNCCDVLPLNRAPTANPGGPYTAIVNSALTLDGTASSDPDGDALTFAWDFGDGLTGTGPAPSHTYGVVGTYNVTLRVTDPGGLFDDGATTTTVRGSFVATVDLDPNVVNLKNRAPWLTAYIEPSGFDPVSIDISTLRLAGSVPAAPKFAIVQDHNANGTPDLMVKFSRGALDPLLIPGVNELEVSGSLVTGEHFEGRDEVLVIDPPAVSLSASVAPNPLNPAGVLTYTTTGAGPVVVKVFDLQGRLVRTLVNAPLLPAGTHEVRIDGRNEQGSKLASGVYQYRVQSVGGVSRGTFIVLR